MLFFKPSLERLGIAVSVRTIDPTQYENRLRSWDFDVVVSSWAESLSPGNEQREYWGSQAADTSGSRNIIGIKNAAIDKLIDRLIYAKDREDLMAATKALDRVLLWNHYVVPQWNYPKVPHRALGPLWPAGRIAEVQPVGVSRLCGDSAPTRWRGTVNGLEGYLAHGATPPPARPRPRPRRAERAASVARACGGGSGHEDHMALSAFGSLKYPADFPHYDYVKVGRAERRDVLSILGRASGGCETFEAASTAFIVLGDAAERHVFDIRFADGACVR